MSRKFNMGRQNDMLLNDKMHSLYTHLEFISYKDGDGNTITMPRQTKQTAIPKGALWLQHPFDTNMHKLRVHTDPEASNMEDRWPCLFEGYYHPADLTTLPTNPVHGQIWIDDKFTLRVYNANGVEGKWEDVCTKLVAETKYDVFNGMDFQIIDPLLPVPLSILPDENKDNVSLFTVPYETYGKYYTAKNHDDEYIYCHPGLEGDPSYDMHQCENSITVKQVIETDGETSDYKAKAWVHVNPLNLSNVTKRLIKINKPKIYYKSILSEIKIPEGYFELEENQGKTVMDCIDEYTIKKIDKRGNEINVVRIDENGYLIRISENGLQEIMLLAEDELEEPIDPEVPVEPELEIPDEDFDVEMNVEPLDPNPVPDDDFDSGMDNDEYEEIPPEDEYDTGMNVEPLDPNPIPDEDFDSEMNVEPLDPNPVPDDDYDSGMNNDEYQEIPPEDYDSEMNVEQISVKYTEFVIIKVIDNSTKLVNIDPNTMIKEVTANKYKLNPSTKDFEIGDIITPVPVSDSNTGFIAIPAGKTEFFAFKSSALNGFDEYDNRIGRLLKRYSLKEGLEDDIVNNDPTILDHRNDYEIRNGGIVLDADVVDEYDYIYAITYEFRANHNIDGNLIRITKESLDGPDQMWVGPCAGIPVVFMDGLYLEHYDEMGASIYTYEKENIIFAGNDVLDNMQIMVISFPDVNTYKDAYGIKYPKEYTISRNNIRNRYEICKAEDLGALRVVDMAIENSSAISYSEVILHTPDLKNKIDNSGDFYVRMSNIKDAVIKGDPSDSLFDEENFPNPLIFYNGLAGYTFVDNEVSIDYETKTITIHNYGQVYDEIDDDDKLTEKDLRDLSTVFAVSLGKNNYKGYGVLEDGVLYDEAISVEDDYIVIVDGIVMSPYNEDITIEDGKITITEATVALDSECTFIRLTRDNDSLYDDTDAILCIYDDMFAPYSIPIVNKNAMNTSNAYDDCDSAVVMCGPGVLVDREAVQRDFNSNDTFIGGQIIKVRKQSVTDDEVYEWRMYTYSNEYVVLDDAQTIYDCEHMITYYINDGTVLLNPVNIDDQPVTVYAYTYVDSVDEKLLRGKRLIPIEIKGHSQNATGICTYSTNRTHLYDVGVNALSVYVNGLLIPHTEKPTTDVKGDLFYVNEQLSSLFIPFINRYEKEVTDNRFNNQDMYNVLMAISDDTVLTDEIQVLTNNNNIIDHCLVMKYFNSDHQLEQAKKLKKYVLNEMRNNSLIYYIENVEHNEFVSCRRTWDLPRNENGNLPNSYVSSTRLIPGIINVYVNGVLLEKDDYAVFDNNKVMVGFDLVGGQEILPKNKGDYAHPYRVLTDEGFKYIECESDDAVTLEVRDDMTIKKRTYRVKDISYETHTFDILDYDYPTSLMYSKDIVKIYINGVLYDGDYTNIDGVITLLECDLEEDPLYNYLRMNPSAMREYEEKYGEYIKHEDTITFEWR